MSIEVFGPGGDTVTLWDGQLGRVNGAAPHSSLDEQFHSRAGFVYPWPLQVTLIPSLNQWWKQWVTRGVIVDVFTAADAKLPPLSPGVEFHPLDDLQLAGSPASTVPAAGRATLLHAQLPYSWFVGVDIQGLEVAAPLHRLLGSRLAYLNLELMPMAEVRDPFSYSLKQSERTNTRSARLVISQDSERAEILSRDLDIKPENIFQLRNAPPGPARRRHSAKLGQQLGVTDDVRIALYTGFVGTHTEVESIVASADTWPERWVLVVHVSPHSPRDAAERMRELAGPRVHVLDEALSVDAHEELIDGADVGVAFYASTPGSPILGENVETIGLSSGKIALYLRAGLPVIIKARGEIARLVRDEGCGEVVETAADISRALDRIGHDLAGFSARSLTAFDRHLDVNPPLTRLLDLLETSAESSEPDLSDEFVETIADGEHVLCLVQRQPPPAATHFVTPPEAALQVGHVVHGRGHKIRAHVHVLRRRSFTDASEVVFVRSGSCRLQIFTREGRPVGETVLGPGDLAVLIDGGHSFDMLEDTVLLEVKAGPYGGADDKRFL